MKYSAEITETLQKTVEIEAENKEDAYRKIREKYASCEIVLTADDYIESGIKILD